jgi:hypothetical protein
MAWKGFVTCKSPLGYNTKACRYPTRPKYAAFVQDGIREDFATPWEGLFTQMVLGDRNFVEKQKE